MVYWNRFISYIYRYHEGRKCENSGFAKVAKTGRTGRITIGLKNGISGRETLYGVYMYRETLPQNGLEFQTDTTGKKKTGGVEGQTPMIPLPVLVGKMKLTGGHGEASFSFCWDDVGGSGRPVTAFAGIAIRLMDSRNNANLRCYENLQCYEHQCYEHQCYENDMFCSSWTDSEVDYSVMWTAGQPEGNGVLDEAVREVSITDDMTTTAVPEIATEHAAEKESRSDTEKAVENMFSKNEHLPLLPGNSLDDGLDSVIESVKITPNDIGLLDMNNWKLGVNSFLTHGYYSYKYLMLGKVLFGPDSENNSYILGVPGVYSAREKYLAGIFGFDRFVPEKEAQIKTGNFGYWIVDIV